MYPLILNLGCGAKTSAAKGVVNVDWSIHLRIRSNAALRVVAPLLLHGERLRYYKRLPENIFVHDISRGLPFSSNTVDVVYHSHLLEHLDAKVARRFLLEVKRVMKPGGIQRIVVPDFEALCKSYVDHIAACDHDPTEISRHEMFISQIIEQMVRREASGTSKQSPGRRFVENLFLGDARKRGETHQWMYDRVSLSALLLDLGFKTPQVQSFRKSQIRNWAEYGLDLDEWENEYKPQSLYVEVTK